jgi:hypothetical protein
MCNKLKKTMLYISVLQTRKNFLRIRIRGFVNFLTDPHLGGQ